MNRELLGIIWAVGKWRHYLAGAHFIIQTDHDSLKNLPNRPAVNRRVWKWVQVLQGYDCDIVHIAGKSNPADYLSRRSIQELRSMVDVHATEESMVQRLRLGEGKSTDEDIQRKLDEVFQYGQLEGSSEHNKCQANSLHSLYSFRSSILSTRSTVLLEPEMKREVREGYANDSRWTDILEQLQSVQGHKQQQGAREYRLAHQLLEVRDSIGQEKKWRIVIPDVPGIKQKILQEIH